jgi:hypothetical protein
MRLNIHWSQIAASSFFLIFITLMSYVVYVAYARRSGSTGLDMAFIQKVRHEASQPPPSL